MGTVYSTPSSEPLEPFLLYSMVGEVHLQTIFAATAFSLIRSNVNVGTTEVVIFCCHTFLAHVALISKMFWPETKGKKAEVAARQARRAALRAELGIIGQSLSIEDRKFRNHLEHYDERLEEWFSESRDKVRVDMNLMDWPSIRGMGVELRDIHRVFNPETGEFIFRGESFDVGLAMREITMIQTSAAMWLKSHGSLSS
jgi:hypothetical protein